MLDSYFFTPGDKPEYLNKIGELKADYFVIDLEESVSNTNKLQAFENVEKLEVAENIFIRIPFKDNIYSKEQIIYLINKFKGRIVLPKVIDVNDIKNLVSLSNFDFSFKIIVLIENPTCFLNISEIIKDGKNHIHAIGFGSHDFCSVMGIKHNLKHLSFYRNQLIVTAKSFNISYVDGVDLNIKNLSNFIDECIFGFNSGADGKFIIHPSQLKKMNEIEYFSENEIIQMRRVQQKASNISDNDIDIIEFEGKIYEKPHLLRINKIINKLKESI